MSRLSPQGWVYGVSRTRPSTPSLGLRSTPLLHHNLIRRLDLLRLPRRNLHHLLRQPLRHQLIRVMLAHQSAVGLFDLVSGGFAVHTQDLVGVRQAVLGIAIGLEAE